MSINYIEIYKVNDELNAKIHKNGKVCTISNQNSIKRLLNICHKHKIYFNGQRELKGNVDPIIKEFDSYYIKAKRRKKLMVIAENLDKISDNITLVRKNPAFGKTVIAATLTATLGITSLVISNNLNESNLNTLPIEQQAVLEEIPEYVIDEENLSPIIANQDNDLEIENIVNDNSIEEIEILEETPIETIEVNEDIEPQETLNEVIESETNETEDEINQMLQSDEFHFSYTDRSNSEEMNNARRYQDLFELYGNRYGVDPNLLMAMAAQENSGQHYEALNGSYATGIMQIERSANVGHTISAFNYETGEVDTVLMTQDAIEDLETNIQVGTMILRNRLEENNYNLIYSLQKYNMGDGNMYRSLSMCSAIENIPIEELVNNRTNPEWLNYREFLGVGDPLYVEHVLSYIPSNTIITMRDRNNNIISSLQIVNDNTNNLQLN